MKPLLLFSTILFLFSCSEKMDIELKSPERLVVECVLTPGKEITATVHTAASFMDASKIKYPSNAKLYLLSQIDAPFEFIYDEKRKVYFIPAAIHTPNPSWKYELRVKKDKDDENEASAKVNFSTAGKIDKRSHAIQSQEKGSQISVSLSTFNSARFVRYKTFFRTIEAISPSGDTTFSDLKELSFLEGSQDYLAFYTSPNTSGVLVDFDRINFSLFDLTYTLPNDISISDIDPNLYIQTSGVSESVYRYDIFKAKQIEAIKSGVSDPVSNYTNFDVIYGTFGSEQTYLQKISLR